MKKKTLFGCIILACGLVASPSFAQTQNAYVLPDHYHFDREVEQVFSNKKNAADSSRVFSYFANSGEYVGLRMQGTMTKHKGWVIVTRTGNIIFFSDRDKTATVISIRKLVSDISGLTKWIKMDSVMAMMRHRTDGKEPRSIKTGKTKTISSYTAEEYSVTDSSGRSSTVWCAKVDFPVLIDYILGAGAGKWVPMISSKLQANPLLQAVVSAGTLVTEIQTSDSLGKTIKVLRTEDIRRTSMDFPTTGYTLIDYSSYSLVEIFHAEMTRNMK